ncbi:transcriptional regulator [Rhizocola hellebori]|uniref:Transcriptional regulator n=1 Tax=Rhizocola hellebori TaxID=1392758 RepID=A0A8J3QL29_9ACTN|nr:winged helix-turn-helix domain-containing protein [Rhizocola hellebori]GIH11378.1 transcriptional regulator [Rhizocola hellebori]
MAQQNTRKITDSGTLAALAHPLRRRLLDILRVDGPATASSLAEKTDQAIANVSHHLRVLGTSNLIEEAPELARDKRERWWRMPTGSLRWSTSDFDDDPAGQVIAETLQQMLLDQHIKILRDWYGKDRDEQGEWVNGAFSSDKWLRLTPQELFELSEQVGELFQRWGRREIPDDGQQREPVLVFAYGMPAKP